MAWTLPMDSCRETRCSRQISALSGASGRAARVTGPSVPGRSAHQLDRATAGSRRCRVGGQDRDGGRSLSGELTYAEIAAALDYAPGLCPDCGISFPEFAPLPAVVHEYRYGSHGDGFGSYCTWCVESVGAIWHGGRWVLAGGPRDAHRPEYAGIPLADAATLRSWWAETFRAQSAERLPGRVLADPPPFDGWDGLTLSARGLMMIHPGLTGARARVADSLMRRLDRSEVLPLRRYRHTGLRCYVAPLLPYYRAAQHFHREWDAYHAELFAALPVDSQQLIIGSERGLGPGQQPELCDQLDAAAQVVQAPRPDALVQDVFGASSYGRRIERDLDGLHYWTHRPTYPQVWSDGDETPAFPHDDLAGADSIIKLLTARREAAAPVAARLTEQLRRAAALAGRAEEFPVDIDEIRVNARGPSYSTDGVLMLEMDTWDAVGTVTVQAGPDEGPWPLLRVRANADRQDVPDPARYLAAIASWRAERRQPLVDLIRAQAARLVKELARDLENPNAVLESPLDRLTGYEQRLALLDRTHAAAVLSGPAQVFAWSLLGRAELTAQDVTAATGGVLRGRRG